jgi:mannose-6-phosphate isomerase-like protein (cupin superfamily)
MEEIIKNLRQKTDTIKGEHYLVGHISDETINGPMRGWLCGHFYPKESIYHRHDIEICVKVLPVNNTEELHYHLCSFEFLIVLSGKVEYEIEGDLHMLEPGSFYILHPGSTEHITQVVEECTILAVRLPSIPNNKIMVEKKDD